MKKIVIVLVLLTSSLRSLSSEIKFIVTYSEELAVFTFLQYLNEEGPDHPHKKIFQSSKYNTPAFQDIVKGFNTIQYNDYTFSYKVYKHKNDFYAESFVKNKLITERSKEEMKKSITGVLSNEEITTLFTAIEVFTPIYNELIYHPNKDEFTRHLNNLKTEIAEKKVQTYFDQAKMFYSSSWNADLPLYLAFYPLLNARGFGASAYNNVSECALPLSNTNYTTILSVLLHELVHILYEEQPVKVQNDWEKWFSESNSLYARFAADILNESWATAVANGYFVLKMSGSLSTGRWYNWKYNDSMARRAYPLFQEYLQSGKAVDQHFVNKYIKTFEDSCKNWLQELPFLMTNRNIMTSDKSHFDTINRIFRYRSIANDFPDYAAESFEKMKKGSIKFIIVSADHKSIHAKIRDQFSELRKWKPDYTKDFMEMKLLEDKSALIIINLVKQDLGVLLRSPKVNFIKE